MTYEIKAKNTHELFHISNNVQKKVRQTPKAQKSILFDREPNPGARLAFLEPPTRELQLHASNMEINYSFKKQFE